MTPSNTPSVNSNSRSSDLLKDIASVSLYKWVYSRDSCRFIGEHLLPTLLRIPKWNQFYVIE